MPEHAPPGFADDAVLAEARLLRKQGDSDAALEFLARAISLGRLSPEAMETAGRFIAKTWKKTSPPGKPLRVLVLGQCTTAWLSATLTAVGWKHGAILDVIDGPYDNVLQEMLSLESQGESYDVAVLLPWNTRLLGVGDRSLEERIEDEMDFWTGVWESARRLGARLVQIGYDLVGPGPSGYHLGGVGRGEGNLIREMNRAMRTHLPERTYFIDLESVSGAHGRRTFYSPRRYFWTKQPFSEHGTTLLAEHVWAGIRAVTTGPKKVLVLDLDNTLWGGIVGETGPLGIELGDSPEGEAFRAFQKFIKGLAARGVVLAVSSKNNPEDAREPFEKNPDMILKFEEFAAFVANWDPKAMALRQVADELRLGLDSFVFFDDNPAEREHIRQALPEVAVVDVPEDPSEYVTALREGLWFEAAELTAEDQERAKQYTVERARRETKAASGSIEDYLRSLDMKGALREINEADMPRVVQLIGKTNQFNLTTRRHSDQKVRELLADPRSIGLTLRITDRFGDYGLISVILAVPDPADPASTLLVDTWLMSCRVIGRTAEEFFFLQLMQQARGKGFTRIRGEYIETPKNALVRELLPRLGFEPVESSDEALRFERRIDEATSIQTYVELDRGV